MDGATRFERVRVIGAGASGTVYEAIDRFGGDRVALKVLRNPTPEGLYRFKKEFRVLRGIEHPNLVRLRELGIDHGEWFFTMDLVPGADFNVFVTGGREGGVSEVDETVELDPRAPRFDEQRLRSAFYQLAQALTALHQRGKVHRDLKPTNVRVRRDGHLILLDFGLVLDEADLTKSDVETIIGTPAYMAPEQIACASIGTAADWYAAGVMLFEALTGKLPFEGSMFEILDVRRRAHPPLASQHAPGIPADLDRLCADLLRADPTARPTAPEVLARLSQVPRLVSARAGAVPSGREAEVRLLGEIVEQTRNGRLAAALLRGPARSAKSAILRHVAEVAADAPMTAVLTACCHAGEHVPYLALDGIVDGLTRVLSELPAAEQRAMVTPAAGALIAAFPVIRRVHAFAEVPDCDTESGEHAIVDALVHVLARVARHRHLVLCIDDLHHADAAGLRVLGALIRHPASPPLALLMAAREQPRLNLPYRVLRIPVQPAVWADEHADDTIEGCELFSARAG
jgi:eukaryotic-like serine/threonine-protein kinase